MAAAPAAEPVPASAPPRPVRRLALQPSATIVGNMAVRKRPTADGLELSWDSAPNVTEWTIRVSVRPDPRQDYVEGEAVALPAASSSYEVALDETRGGSSSTATPATAASSAALLSRP